MNQQIEILLQSANNGDTSAMLELSIAFYNGDGVPEDEEKSLQWLYRAVELRDPRAQEMLGDLFSEGILVQKSDESAYDCYLKGAYQGNTRCMQMVGLAYEQGRVVEKDIQTALSWYIKAAEAGDACAALYLGELYEQGHLVEQNMAAAFEWYMIAAKADHQDGQVAVAKAYATGTGTSKNLEEAVEWYKKAAQNGNAEACGKIGAAYQFGIGLATGCDMDQAIMWFREGADRGDPESQYQLAEICLGRNGSKENDPDSAVAYYTAAADQYHPGAMNALGKFYFEGDILPININKAVDLLEKAISAGVEDGAFMVGRAYYEGYEVHTNKDKALPFLITAAKNGIQDAYQYIARYVSPGSDGNSGFNAERARKTIELAAMEGDVILLGLLARDRMNAVANSKAEPEDNIRELQKALSYIRRAKDFGQLSDLMKQYENWICRNLNLQREAIEINENSMFSKFKKMFKRR